MADTGMGIIYLGIISLVGCVLKIAESAVVQDVNVVPNQGQSQPSQPYPQFTGQYPNYPNYPHEANPAYTVPGQPAPTEHQYPGGGQYQGHAYPQQAPSNYHPQPGGHLTPGQTGTSHQAAAYPDHFAGAPAAAPYPQHQPQAYPDPADPSHPHLQAQAHAQAQTQAQAQPQTPAQTQADAHAQAVQAHAAHAQAQSQPQAQAQSPAQAQTPAVGALPHGYPQGQPMQPPPQAGQFPYYHGAQQYPGSFMHQQFQGHPQGGYPNSQIPEAAAASSNPDPKTAPQIAQGSNMAVPDPQQPVQPAGSPPAGFPQTAPGSPPGSDPASAYPGHTPTNPVITDPQHTADVTANSASAAAAAVSQAGEHPASSAISGQKQSAFKAQASNMIQYNMPEKKPSFPPLNGAADPQTNVIVGSQPGFPPPRGQSTNSVPGPVSMPFPNHHPAPPPQQYPPVSYPGHPTAHGTVPQQSYPAARGYPYQGQYMSHHPNQGMAPYPGSIPPANGRAPYPGGAGVPYTDPQGRPYPGSALNARTPKQPQQQQGQQQHHLQYPQRPQHLQNPHHPHHPNPHHRFPPSNGAPIAPKPVTTTMPPETTLGATPFPRELRCFAQGECELGCCYASDGSILWDHQNNYGKEGYCYTKTTTIPGEGCHPVVCPCQSDQFCISVPNENATMPVPGEIAEGAMYGSPKCYTDPQQMQIHNWLKQLETIVFSCRFDPNCPLTAMHHK